MKNYYRMIYNNQILNSLETGYKIVAYNKIDHHEIIPLIYADSFNKDPWPSNWDEIDEFDSRGVFLVKIDNQYIGFIIGFKRKDFGYISVCAVKNDFQRRGIATTLIHKEIEYLKSIGLKTLYIDVEVANVPAVKTYEKYGFKAVKTFEDD